MTRSCRYQLGRVLLSLAASGLWSCSASQQQLSDQTQATNQTQTQNATTIKGNQVASATNNGASNNGTALNGSQNTVDNFAAASINNAVDSEVDLSAGPNSANALNTPPVVPAAAPLSQEAMPSQPLNTVSPVGHQAASSNSMVTANTTTPPTNATRVEGTDVSVQTSSTLMDLGPPHGVLTWVGYNYRRADKKLDIQIVTTGKPVYKMFQEVNRAGQTELVVRFLNTKLRRKIRRDVDATEFRSPVAYIRMRADHVYRHSDVILTMREAVQPSFVAKGSSIMLTFDLSDKWFGPIAQDQTPVAKTEIQSETDVLPIDQNAKAVAVYVDDPGRDVFAKSKDSLPPSTLKEVPSSKELVPTTLDSTPGSDKPQSGAPAKSENPTKIEEQTEVRVLRKRFFIAGVAQAEGNYTTNIPAPIVNAVPLNAAASPTALNIAPTNLGAPIGNASVAGPEVIPVQTADLQGVEQNASAAAAAPPKKLMKFDFRNATIGNVLRAIASESGLNFVMPPEVSNQKVTVSISNVSWDVALKAVLESNRLGMEEIGPRIIRIDTLKTFADDRDAQERARQASEALVPTKVLVMRLSYADAEEASKMVAQMMPKVSDANNLAQKRNYDRFKVQFDKRSNAVIVEAIPSELAKIKSLLERIDTRTPQVKISSRIVEVLETAERGLGVSWGSPLNIDAGRGLGFGSLPFPNSLTSTFAVDPVMKSQPVGAMSLKLGSINNMFALDLQLKMLESRSEAESLQNQDVMIEDNQEALIVAGSSDFYQIPGNSQSGPTMTEVLYNTSLKVTPHITSDGAVQMKLEIVGDSPKETLATGAAAGKITRKLTTTLLRKTGDTAVIGGLYTTDRQKLVNGVPVLSKLPIIGALFRSSVTKDNRRDLLIMITPSIQSSSQIADEGPSGAALGNNAAVNASMGVGNAASRNNRGNIAANSQWQGASNQANNTSSNAGQQSQTSNQGYVSENNASQQNSSQQQSNQQNSGVMQVDDQEGLEDVEL